MEDIEVADPSQELIEDFDWQELVGKPKVSNDEFKLIPNPIEVECVAEEIIDPIEGLYHEIDIASVSKSSSSQQSEDEGQENLLVQPESSTAEDLTKASELENKDDIDEPQIQSNRLKVNTNSCDVVIFDGAVKELAKLVGILIEWMEIKLANSREFSLRMSSFDCLRSFDAHKVFVKMPRKGVHVMILLRVGDCLSNLVGFGGELKQHSITLPYDRGKEEPMSCCLDSSNGGFDSLDSEASGAGGIHITPSFDQLSCISGAEIANRELRFIRNVQAVYFEIDRLLLSSGCEETPRSIVNLFISGTALQFHRERASLDNIQVQLVPTMNFVFSLGRVWVSQAVKQGLILSGKLCTDMVEVPTGKGFVFDPGGLDPLLGS